MNASRKFDRFAEHRLAGLKCAAESEFDK